MGFAYEKSIYVGSIADALSTRKKVRSVEADVDVESQRKRALKTLMRRT